MRLSDVGGLGPDFHRAGRESRHLLAVDCRALAGLCLLALCAGLLLNALRREPLPLGYISAAARLQTAVARLAAGVPSAQPVEQIGLAAFRQIGAQRTGFIVDARPDVFYRAGHVPGAYNLARESFGKDYGRLQARLEAAKDSPIVVYCADADCPDGTLVAAALRQLGFPHVVDFAGGWEAWTVAGLPEEKQTPP